MLTVNFSWNKALAKQHGIDMGGAEFLNRGINVMLGPVVGLLGRIAEGDRNREGFSNDPYLAGALVKTTIQGVQSSGVGTCVKVRHSLVSFQFSVAAGSKANDDITLSAMDKKQTEHLERTPWVFTRKLFRQISKTRPCMDFIFGHFRMQFLVKVFLLCVRINASIILMVVKIAKH
jgi:hypothetical protein